MNNTNAVRQVLMNELGLTREFIREETRKIVEAEVSKVVAQMMQPSELERLVSNKFNELVKPNKWSHPTIQTFVEEAAKNAAAEFVKTNLRLEASATNLSAASDEVERLQAENEALTEIARWAYSKLHGRTFSALDDALMLDRIKLLLEHGHVG